MKKVFVLLVAVIMLVGVFAGCSGAAKTTQSAAAATTAAAAATTKAAAATSAAAATTAATTTAATTTAATTTTTASSASEAMGKATEALAGRKPKNGSTWHIGVSTQAWEHEFIKNEVNAFKAADEKNDKIELTLVDSQDSVEKQLSDIDTLIAQNVDGIILNCDNKEGCSSAVQACKNANIPLVEVVSYTQSQDYATFVGTDVQSSGRLAMDLGANLINKKGKLFVIEGIIGHTAQINRGAGIAAELKKYPDIQMVEKQCGEFSKDKSIDLTNAWLTKYPKGQIDLIIAHNDDMALGAMNACLAAGRTEIKIVGIDGTADALKGIISGTYGATALDNVEVEVNYAVQEMQSILEGSKPKGQIIVDYVPITTKEVAQKYLDERTSK